MFTFISIMAVQVLIGYPYATNPKLRKITPLIHIVVCLLLFLLGLSIGLNRLIIDNLGYFCGQAAVISLIKHIGQHDGLLAVYPSFQRKGQAVKSSLVTLAFFLVWLRRRVSYAVDFDVRKPLYMYYMY